MKSVGFCRNRIMICYVFGKDRVYLNTQEGVDYVILWKRKKQKQYLNNANFVGCDI